MESVPINNSPVPEDASENPTTNVRIESLGDLTTIKSEDMKEESLGDLTTIKSEDISN